MHTYTVVISKIFQRRKRKENPNLILYISEDIYIFKKTVNHTRRELTASLPGESTETVWEGSRCAHCEPSWGVHGNCHHSQSGPDVGFSKHLRTAI